VHKKNRGRVLEALPHELRLSDDVPRRGQPAETQRTFAYKALHTSYGIQIHQLRWIWSGSRIQGLASCMRSHWLPSP
jgi:hypothetical protein